MTETGRELDAAVEVEVFGRKVRRIVNDDSSHAGEWCRCVDGCKDYVGDGGLVYQNDPGDCSIVVEVPHYSTDMAAAWSVVENLTSKEGGGWAFSLMNHGWCGRDFGCWVVFYRGAANFYAYSTKEEGAALAICRAARAAKRAK